MASSFIKFSLVTNNSELEEYFFDQKNFAKINFVKNKHQANYHLCLIDLENDLKNTSQVLIELYQYCRENNQKLSVVLLHGQKLDTEKNKYLKDILDEIILQSKVEFNYQEDDDED